MKNPTIEELWYLYQSETTAKFDKELSEFFKNSEACREKLLQNMSDEDKNLFETYQQAMTKIECIVEKDAFVKGVKFASKFLVEAMSQD